MRRRASRRPWSPEWRHPAAPADILLSASRVPRSTPSAFPDYEVHAGADSSEIGQVAAASAPVAPAGHRTPAAASGSKEGAAGVQARHRQPENSTESHEHDIMTRRAREAPGAECANAVGRSVVDLRRAYSDATAKGNHWTLVRYFYGAGFYVTQLGAVTGGGRSAPCPSSASPTNSARRNDHSRGLSRTGAQRDAGCSRERSFRSDRPQAGKAGWG
jgi:hypothetical protein